MTLLSRLLIAFALLLIAAPVGAQTPPPFMLTIDAVTPPTACGVNGWSIDYQRTIAHNLPAQPIRYVVQRVNGYVTLTHTLNSGYNDYVQDYRIEPGTGSDQIDAVYVVPLWSNTYDAETIHYVLADRAVLWEVRAALSCVEGAVADYSLTTQAVEDMTLDDLPPLSVNNLVLATDTIPLYRVIATQTGRLGAIAPCQTFFLSAIRQPRASLYIYGRESISGRQIMLFDGAARPPLVDVDEDYGQPNGQPILELCAPPSAAVTPEATAEASS